MFDVSRLPAMASSLVTSAPSLPSRTNMAKGFGLGLTALFLRSLYGCKPIESEGRSYKLGHAAMQATLFEGAALLGAFGINKASKYLVGKTFTQLHMPLGVALTTLGITTFFVFMHKNREGGQPTRQQGLEKDEASTPVRKDPEENQPPQTVYGQNGGGWGTALLGTPAQVAGATHGALGSVASPICANLRRVLFKEKDSP